MSNVLKFQFKVYSNYLVIILHDIKAINIFLKAYKTINCYVSFF